MKIKQYTLNHQISMLKEIDNDGKQFSANEHSYLYKKLYSKNIFRTKESLLRYYLTKNYKKLETLGFLINHIDKNKFKNILSMGAGEFVLEYLLKLALSGDSKVVGCDFNSLFIRRAQEFFPEIDSFKFDFFNDSIEKIQHKYNNNFDLVIFLGSAYVMDDDKFIEHFKNLKISGAKQIIDFHAGYMSFKSAMNIIFLNPIKHNNMIRKIFGKSPMSSYKGKFHGYLRDRHEIRKLYKRSGLKLKKEFSIGNYRYVSILE